MTSAFLDMGLVGLVNGRAPSHKSPFLDSAFLAGALLSAGWLGGELL